LAWELATAGVCVVSGLALGIDGAAHAGALEGFRGAAEGWVAAPTVGVAASGVDVVYPRQHAALWRQVASTGAVISETPPGTPAQSWRFPARNRVIAGLARMVVVVESHVTGGSWHTVDAALRRGVEVAAVPGSVHSPASAGTNALLRDGATPVRGAQDVLDALGLQGGAVAPPEAGDARNNDRSTAAGAPHPLAERVLAALGWRPLCLEELVERSGLPVGAAVVVLDQLEAAGEVVSSEDGWWCRRT
jgi:DNA processing protein